VYELIQAGPRTWYMECPARVGVWEMGEGRVCLIDAGSDRDAAKKLLRNLEAKGWKLDRVLNTHSHADHIGGNRLLQQRTGCAIYCPGVDWALARFPVLEPAYLYGGRPGRPLRNKFLMAGESEVQLLGPGSLPEGMELLEVPGHSFSQAAFKTPDGVWFLADCLASAQTLEKYHVAVLHDPALSRESLHRVMELEGEVFVPAHAPAMGQAALRALAQKNLEKMDEIEALLLALCAGGASFEQLIKGVFDHYGLTLDLSQYVLVGSTLRSYLAYLADEGRLEMRFADNRLCWHSVPVDAQRKP